jgi:large subunit ribosomal protein L13e
MLLKAAGFNRKFAQTVGIAVDHRRTNKCEESLNANVERLKSYKARLVIFPRRSGITKKGDSSPSEVAAAHKVDVDISQLPKRADAVTFAKITDVRNPVIICFKFNFLSSLIICFNRHFS